MNLKQFVYLWKIDRFNRVLEAVAVGEIAENIETELVELLAQKFVHDKELHNRVDQIDDFDEKVRSDQIVAQIDTRAAE